MAGPRSYERALLRDRLFTSIAETAAVQRLIPGGIELSAPAGRAAASRSCRGTAAVRPMNCAGRAATRPACERWPPWFCRHAAHCCCVTVCWPDGRWASWRTTPNCGAESDAGAVEWQHVDLATEHPLDGPQAILSSSETSDSACAGCTRRGPCGRCGARSPPARAAVRN